MKKFYLTLTILFTSLAAAVVSAAAPESFIPDNSPVIMRFNANKAVQLPWLEKISRENKDFKKFTRDLDELKAQTNIEPKDFFAGEFWAAQYGKGQNDFVCFFKTALTKSKFKKLLADANFRKKEKLEVKSQVISGVELYTLKKRNKAAEKAVIAYPAEDVIMLFDSKADAQKLIAAALNGGKNPRLKVIDRKTLFALYGDAKKIDLPAQTSRVKRLKLTADLTEPEQRDLLVNGKLGCKNEKSALQLAMQIQFMYPGVVGMLFGKDEALAAALMKALQVMPEKNYVIVQFALDAAVQDKVFKYMSNPANRPDFKNNGVGPKPQNKSKAKK